MRHDALYHRIETLAQAAFDVLEAPSDGFTVQQAALIKRRAQNIIRSVDKLNRAIHTYVDENTIELLKRS